MHVLISLCRNTYIHLLYMYTFYADEMEVEFVTHVACSLIHFIFSSYACFAMIFIISPKKNCWKKKKNGEKIKKEG